MPSEAAPEPPALRRLRRHVAHAAETLDRLRRENERLRARVQELEANPGFDYDGTLLPLDDDAAALRKKVEGFVEALDAHLAQTAEA